MTTSANVSKLEFASTPDAVAAVTVDPGGGAAPVNVIGGKAFTTIALTAMAGESHTFS